MFSEPGATLTELLIIIIVIGLLAAISVPKFAEIKKRAQDSAVTVEVAQEIVQAPPLNHITTTISDLNNKPSSDNKTLYLVSVWLGFIFSIFFLTILKEKI